LVRFIIIVAFTMIWCSSVGHPSVLLVESDTVVETQDNGDANGLSKEDSPPSGRRLADSICKAPDSTFQERYDAVRVYLDSLAKPVGSLGTLEDWAARLAALQRTTRPVVDPVACLIFAGDHGAAKSPEQGGEGCSSYPQAVTRSVLVGLERGIAGASVLAKANNVSLRVVDVGVVGVTNDNNVVYASPNKLQGGGTRNFCTGPAMTTEEVERCIRIGRDELAHCISENDTKAIVLGEIGIGNTTASSALIAQLTKAGVESVCGGGATLAREVDQAAITKKVAIVKKALKLHGSSIKGGTDTLAKLGGAEIASLVGAMLEASERNIPILIDGFIVTAAALVAANISPNACRIMFLTTQSGEKGQATATDSIQSIAAANGIPAPERPALAMNLRMGEATAALLAVPILRSAAAVLTDMGTIEDILSN
jgi:nicotinate-nucleotide--dimethylbenzimidazole phosphoribosyltransferase